MREAARGLRRGVAIGASFVGLNVAFRFPLLLNAAGLTSDAAVVGLQAIHMLRGEVSRFLWGAGYQGSFDTMMVALSFAVGGATPLMLMLTPLLGHLLLTFFAWNTLARRLSPWKAALACLPIVFTPAAINSVVSAPPRQFCLTTLFAAIWLIDGAAKRRWPPLWLGAGVAVGASSLFMDLYGLQLFGPIVVFALLCCWDAPRTARSVSVRVLAVGVGLALGLYAVQWLRNADGATDQPVTLTFDIPRLKANWKLLSETCLPWLLGAPRPHHSPDPWVPPLWFRVLQIGGAFSFVLLVASAVPLALVKRIPWRARRLGLLGAGAALASLLGYMLSTMPTDWWSARYLAPIIWAAPFALCPLAVLLSGRQLAAALALYTMIAAVGGWRWQAPSIDGPWPVRDPRGTAAEEYKMGAFLRARGIRYAAAQYWLSYRLTFLFHEQPVVIPLDPRADRYQPYADAFQRERRVAYIFHPSETRALPSDVLPKLRKQKGRIEVVDVEGFTVIIHDRR